jgi:hypothetical protein
MPSRLLLLVLLSAGLLSSTVPVQADDPVAAAERAVSALREKAAEATAELETGTRRLEADQRRLDRTQRQAAVARREADAAQEAVARSRSRLAVVVAAAYRNPAPDDLMLITTGGPDALREAVLARADLDHVRGSEQDLLRTATAERVRAEGLVRTADQLETSARDRQRTVARTVDALRALADRSAAQLQKAADRLAEARTRAAAAARASRLRAASTVATCGGGTIAGAANGFLPTEALCPLDGAPGHALRADAATAFNRMNAARRQCVTSSYRSYAGQVDVYRRKPSLAAVPGTSLHGRGLALDLGCGAERFGSDAYLWLKANAGQFGFVHPAWAEPGGSKPEPWHWEYSG